MKYWKCFSHFCLFSDREWVLCILHCYNWFIISLCLNCLEMNYLYFLEMFSFCSFWIIHYFLLLASVDASILLLVLQYLKTLLGKASRRTNDVFVSVSQHKTLQECRSSSIRNERCYLWRNQGCAFTNPRSMLYKTCLTRIWIINRLQTDAHLEMTCWQNNRHADVFQVICCTFTK